MGSLFVSMLIPLVFVFPAYLISLQVSRSPAKQKAAKERALRDGHVVTATLQRSHSPRTVRQFNSELDYLTTGIYQYEYKGRSYSYRHLADDPPYTLTLYFLHDPAKAAPENGIVLTRYPWWLWYLVVFVLLKVI